jgi:hypothetical protein
MSAASTTPGPLRYWREMLLVLVPSLGLVGVLLLAPIPQDPRYHHFADIRTLLGVPNFANIVSNLPFLIVGIAGLALSFGARRTGAWACWATFFTGVALVCLGSGYYHAAPTDAALVWDRLPMTVAFMGLFVALLSEHVTAPLARYLLLPALVAGIASIGWWHVADDLRFYVWVQSAPLLVIPLALLLFPPRYTHRFYLLYGLAFYLLAKIAELYDQELYALTQGALSGHSLKHLLASLSALSVYLMLRRRQRLPLARAGGDHDGRLDRR